MAKKTLQQFVESTKHSFIARIIVAADKMIIRKTLEQNDFIAWVKNNHEDACKSLSRRGRDPLTSIMVCDIWHKKEVLDHLDKIGKEASGDLLKALSNDSEYCFCHCNIKIREVEIRGPSR